MNQNNKKEIKKIINNNLKNLDEVYKTLKQHLTNSVLYEADIFFEKDEAKALTEIFEFNKNLVFLFINELNHEFKKLMKWRPETKTTKTKPLKS